MRLKRAVRPSCGTEETARAVSKKRGEQRDRVWRQSRELSEELL